MIGNRPILLATLLLAVPTFAAAEAPLPPGAVLRLGQPRFRHGSLIGAMLVTPDGRSLVTAGGGFVRVWDLATGEPRLTFRGISMPGPDFFNGSYLAISPDGKMLACGGRDGGVSFWNMTGGKERPIPPSLGNEPVAAVSFSPNSQRLLVAKQLHKFADGLILYWDMTRDPPSLVTHMTGDGWTQFSSDGRAWRLGHRIFGLGEPFESVDEPASEKNCRRVAMTNGALLPAVSTDGRTAAFAKDDEFILYDVRREAPEYSRIAAIKRTGNIAFVALALSPKGDLFATAEMHDPIRLWHARNGRALRSFPMVWEQVRCLAFSPDGATLYSGHYDGAIRRWNVATGLEIIDLRADHVSVAARSANGELIATGGDDGFLSIREAAGGLILAKWKVHAADVAHLAFVGPRQIASLGPAGDLRFWDLDTKKEFRPAVELGKIGGCVAFSPAGPKIAMSTTQRYQEFVKDLASGMQYELPHDAALMTLAFSADGKRLATSGSDSPVHIWNITGAPKPLLTLPLGERKRGHASALAFAPDGTRLAMGHVGSDISLWDAADGTELWSHVSHTEKVRSIAFSPDGLWLASGGEDGGASVWDTETGRQVFHCEAHAGAVTQVLFGRDPRNLLTVSRDGTAILWNLRPKEFASKSLSQCWSALASGDAQASFAAWWAVAERPEAARHVAERLRETQRNFDSERIALRLSELDNPRFATREAASRELAALRTTLEPLLRKELAAAETPEKRVRLRKLLEGLAHQRLPEQLRQLRAVSALAASSEPEAKAAVQELARGPALSPVTQAAQAELARGVQK